VPPWSRSSPGCRPAATWPPEKAHPAASRSDIDYLLEHVNAVINSPLAREDVEGVYAGLRPLLSGESESTSKL
jgi:glycerol-3-phosphate dehydrogenase